MAVLPVAALALMAGVGCSSSADDVSATTCAEAFRDLDVEVEASVRETYVSCNRDDWLAEADQYLERHPYPPSHVVLGGPEERLRQVCDDVPELAAAPACDG